MTQKLVTPTLHSVAAWSVASRVTLGRRSVGQKFKEINANHELLKNPEPIGAIVTTGATGSRKEIAARIFDGDEL